ncbi:cadherin-like domain-containing protein [Roseospira navarrensis]|uniref:Tandem-95 repeat protein n=1 Tax=Roseospira navarrensis TaxID=140058 RepID=A0A7X2D3F1_9PROT|nr:cadherin-like domain-containing protein [Roseospira navarrensis]MQX35527.1 tandem-95 repeat protein [Roseospira navarrensis]
MAADTTTTPGPAPAPAAAASSDRQILDDLTALASNRPQDDGEADLHEAVGAALDGDDARAHENIHQGSQTSVFTGADPDVETGVLEARALDARDPAPVTPGLEIPPGARPEGADGAQGTGPGAPGAEDRGAGPETVARGLAGGFDEAGGVQAFVPGVAARVPPATAGSVAEGRLRPADDAAGAGAGGGAGVDPLAGAAGDSPNPASDDAPDGPDDPFGTEDPRETAGPGPDGPALNQGPVGADDILSSTEDTAVTYAAADLLANDTDVDGDALALTDVSNAVGGTVSLNADGDVVFTPDADFHGEATFDYTVSDGQGGTSTATVTVDVAAVNDGPVAADDAQTATEDTAVTYSAADLLANDTDVDGDALTITDVSNAVGGSVSLNADGDVVFTPDADFNGEATFDYTVSDGQGGTSTATVTVDVAAVNDGPVAADDAQTATEDTAVTYAAADLLANDTDVDGDALTLTDVSNAVGGTVSLNADGDVVFTPDADFNGEATFDYTVSDGQGGTSTATVTVDVAAVNDGPVIEGLRDSVRITDVSDLTYNHDFGTNASFPDLSEDRRLDADEVNGVDPDALTLQHDHDVTVTFVSEGAGYHNTLGWYVVEEDGTINNPQIVYGDATDTVVAANGTETVTLTPPDGGFEGKTIGFFLIGNGHNKNKNSDFWDDAANNEGGRLAFVDENGDPATTSTDTPKLVFIQEDGSVHTVKSQGGIYHSVAANETTALNPDNEQHAISGVTPDGDSLMVGFEDLKGLGDHDYNDLVFTVNVGADNARQMVATAVAPDIQVSDLDSPTLMSAEARISEGMQPGDELHVDGLTVNEDGTIGDTGISLDVVEDEGGYALKFTGEADEATYTDVLARVKLQNSGETPETGDRVVSFTVSDGEDSTTDHATVRVVDGTEDTGAEGSDPGGAAQDSNEPAPPPADPDVTFTLDNSGTSTPDYAGDDVVTVTESDDDVANPWGAINADTQLADSDGDGASIGVDRWNSAKSVRAEGEAGADVTIDNFVRADVDLSEGTGDSTVTIDDAKRGSVETADGDDVVDIDARTNGSGWDNTFTVDTGAGDDTITGTGDDGQTHFNIKTGEGADSVTLDGQSASATVVTEDAATINVSGADTVDVTTGESFQTRETSSGKDYKVYDDNSITVDDAEETAVHTGRGDDTITVSANGEGTDTVFVDSGHGSDTINITGEGGETHITVDGGYGRDSVTLDGAYGSSEVHLDGGTAWTKSDGTVVRKDNLTEDTATRAHDDTFAGGVGDDLVTGGGGDDVLDGGDGDDRLFGDSGEDTLAGGRNDDRLSGGKGTDTAIFRGPVEDYDITVNEDGTITVADQVADRDGTDILDGIETLQFGDTTLDQDGLTDLLAAREAADQPSPFAGTTVTIDTSNYDSTDQGFAIKAINIDADGNRTEALADNVSHSKHGLGANGNNASGPASQIGYDADSGQGEALVIELDAPASSATATFTRAFANEAGGEQVRWEAYKDGEKVGEGNETAESGHSGAVTIESDGAVFDEIRFVGDTYADGAVAGNGDASDFMVQSVEVNFADAEELAAADASGRGPHSGPGDIMRGTDFQRPGVAQREETVSEAEATTLTDGKDSVDYSDADAGVVVDALDGKDTVIGSDHDDHISGGGSKDMLSGGAGNDTLLGGEGKDTLFGGDGNDILKGGAANDDAFGEAGDDLFLFGQGDEGDSFDGGEGWTDTVVLEGVTGAPGDPDADWTLQVEGGVTWQQDGNALEFDEEASGTVTLEDGSELAFANVERIEW